MLWIVPAGFALGKVPVCALVGRTMKPQRLVVQGLHRMEQGAYDTRLPELQDRMHRLSSRLDWSWIAPTKSAKGCTS
jgi:hypothetical protein